VTTPLGDEDAEVQSGPRLLAGVPFLSPGAQAPSLGHFSCWIGVRAPEPLTWQGGDVAGAPAQPVASLWVLSSGLHTAMWLGLVSLSGTQFPVCERGMAGRGGGPHRVPPRP
jgi:hypothetical protein